MLGWFRWRGRVPAVTVFATVMAALVAAGSTNGTSEYWILAPMAISLAVLAVLMWIVDRRSRE